MTKDPAATGESAQARYGPQELFSCMSEGDARTALGWGCRSGERRQTLVHTERYIHCLLESPLPPVLPAIIITVRRFFWRTAELTWTKAERGDAGRQAGKQAILDADRRTDRRWTLHGHITSPRRPDPIWLQQFREEPPASLAHPITDSCTPQNELTNHPTNFKSKRLQATDWFDSTGTKLCEVTTWKRWQMFYVLPLLLVWNKRNNNVINGSSIIKRHIKCHDFKLSYLERCSKKLQLWTIEVE